MNSESADRAPSDATLTMKASWDFRVLGTGIRNTGTVTARSTNSDEWQVMGVCNARNVEAWYYQSVGIHG
jgi:hypothetical protein